jgi:hypothetical protein
MPVEGCAEHDPEGVACPRRSVKCEHRVRQIRPLSRRRILDMVDDLASGTRGLDSRRGSIYAMASKGYGYDPAQKRSNIVSEVVSDMALAGLPLSEDTVRRYLKEASDNLNEWRERSK